MYFSLKFLLGPLVHRMMNQKIMKEEIDAHLDDIVLSVNRVYHRPYVVHLSRELRINQIYVKIMQLFDG